MFGCVSAFLGHIFCWMHRWIVWHSTCQAGWLAGSVVIVVLLTGFTCRRLWLLSQAPTQQTIFCVSLSGFINVIDLAIGLTFTLTNLPVNPHFICGFCGLPLETCAHMVETMRRLHRITLSLLRFNSNRELSFRLAFAGYYFLPFQALSGSFNQAGNLCDLHSTAYGGRSFFFF